MPQTLVDCSCGRGKRDVRATTCRTCWREARAARAAERLCPHCGNPRRVVADNPEKTRYRCPSCEAADARARRTPKPRKGRAPRQQCQPEEPCGRMAEYLDPPLCRTHYGRLRKTGTTLPRPHLPADPLLAHRAAIRAGARAIGLDPVMVVAHFEAHNGLCDICNQPPTRKRLDIDHDHQTGVFRGLLCGNCNRALGLLADNPDRLLAGAAYLRR